jgi:hypothetical protein
MSPYSALRLLWLHFFGLAGISIASLTPLFILVIIAPLRALIHFMHLTCESGELVSLGSDVSCRSVRHYVDKFMCLGGVYLFGFRVSAACSTMTHVSYIPHFIFKRLRDEHMSFNGPMIENGLIIKFVYEHLCRSSTASVSSGRALVIL